MRVVNRMASGKSMKKPPRRPERLFEERRFRSAARAARHSFDLFTHEALDQGWQIIIKPFAQHRAQHVFRDLIERATLGAIDGGSEFLEGPGDLKARIM